jgi:hypothetical protein
LIRPNEEDVMPVEPSAPARRNMPMIAAVALAALLALGLAFAWPW